MAAIENKKFRVDFNSQDLTNEQLLKKYGFINSKDLCNYAKENGLTDKQKPLTEKEEKNLSLMARQLKECMGMLQ